MVEVERVELHQHLLPDQQAEHARDQVWRELQLRGQVGGVWRLQPAGFHRGFEPIASDDLFGIERDLPPCQREAVTPDDDASRRQIRQHTLEEWKRRAGKETLPDLFARDALRERLCLMKVANEPFHPLGEPRAQPGLEQCSAHVVYRSRGNETRDDVRCPARRHTRSYRQLHTRKPPQPLLFDKGLDRLVAGVVTCASGPQAGESRARPARGGSRSAARADRG